MSRIADFNKYKNTKSIDELARDNIVFLCEDNSLRTVKDVLYQIRSNIFHGEKLPGEVNDDRIVKASFPLLNKIVSNLIQRYNI